LPASMVEIHEIGKVDDGSSVFADVDDEHSTDLSVFPNPVNDILNISFKKDIDAVRIVSLQGQDIRVPVVARDNRQIDINQLAPGIYFLYVQSGNEWYPVRFSKM